MAPKLGEILVAGRHLTPADLKKALDAQLVFGGRLGTNLIDLGLLDEETLTRVLHEQKHVEVATPKMLEEADPKALRLLPAKIAARHHAIPFAVAEHELKVALLDPTDLIAIDEIAFASGCRVIPYIAPEVRILGCLERYYDVVRPVRYVRLAADDRPGHVSTASRPAMQPAAAPAPVAPPVRSLDEVLGSEPPAEPAAEPPGEEGDLEETARRLAEADTREEIGDALLLLLRQEFARSFLWIIQRDQALGWLAHAPGLGAAAARAWARRAHVDLTQPSVLADVVASKRYYLGELPSRAADDTLATLHGDPRVKDLLLVPVMLADQVVVVAQADAGGKPLTSFDLKAVRTACQKASMAMEVLLIRSKIRQA
jgi:hypothetical protein